nr:hypothetical protein [Mammaliicoccus sp. Marseille-Q6498]
MNNQQYKSIVIKKLWFINKKETKTLNSKLDVSENDQLIDKFGKPSQFVNQFIDDEIIGKAQAPGTFYKMITLGGLLFGNVIMVGILISAALLILGTFTLYFTKPINEAIMLQVLYLVIGVVLLFIGYKGMRWVNAYFTKRLLIAKRFKDIS